MKLKNKKTGEIGWLYCDYISIPKKMTVFAEDKDLSANHWDYKSLAELNEEWEDYEEPENFYIVEQRGTVGSRFRTGDEYEKKFKEIGNYFETREEAEKAVEKLKAWHKLMDYWGTEVLGWEIRDMPTGGNWQTVNVKFNVKTKKEPMELLDIVFGGEE